MNRELAKLAGGIVVMAVLFVLTPLLWEAGVEEALCGDSSNWTQTTAPCALPTLLFLVGPPILGGLVYFSLVPWREEEVG